jgi:hypothetical protein
LSNLARRVFAATIVAAYGMLICCVISFYMVFRGILTDILPWFSIGFFISYYVLVAVIVWAEKKFSL